MAAAEAAEYVVVSSESLPVWDSPACETLATEAWEGRRLQARVGLLVGDDTHGGSITQGAGRVVLCEDAYPGWIKADDCAKLALAEGRYVPAALDEAAIEARIPKVLAFTERAQRVPNEYLWGGVVGPNYDCSGLMQRAFESAGIWIPRDAYQQEAFTTPVDLAHIRPGDLVFFGTPDKATHVGICTARTVSAGLTYRHSSGATHGHDGIAEDALADDAGSVAAYYHSLLRGAGRVTSCCTGLARMTASPS
eukprot:jgi/Chlat1/8279/Chrsp78S07707